MAARFVFLAPQRSLRRVTSSFVNSYVRGVTTGVKLRNEKDTGIDPKLLEILVCPLSKTPLRHDPEANELICDDLGVAYPIVNGIPHLVPTDGRLVNENTNDSKSTEPTSE